MKKNHKVERVWNHRGNVCVVLMTDSGHRCGYVGIPRGHPLFGAYYGDHSDRLRETLEKVKSGPIGKRGIVPLFCWDGEKASPELVFDVHGGITYSGGEDKYPIDAKDVWWFGYDCAHAGDAKDKRRISKFMKELELKYPIRGVLRTLAYCIKECESLSDQLEETREEEKC